MKPGREMDALVAEKVLGCKPTMSSRGKRCVCEPKWSSPHGGIDGAHTPAAALQHECCGYDDCRWRDTIEEDFFAPYSTDIAAAWTVVEHLTSAILGNPSTLHDSLQLTYESGAWHVTIDREGFGDDCMAAPEAICRAALSAVGFQE